MFTRCCAFLLDAILILALAATVVFFSFSDEEIIQNSQNTLVILQALENGDPLDPALMEGKELTEHISNVLTSSLLIIFWTYFIISESLMKGSSLGKKVFSLKVIKRFSSQSPSMADSILRSGIKSLSFLALLPLPLALIALSFPPFAIFAVDYFVPFFRSDKRALHDLFSKTWVVVPTHDKLLDEIT